MKCQSCGKKEATVKYMENINGNKQELHFCYDCAKKLGFVNFSNIFSPIFVTIPDYEQSKKLECKNCGYSFDDYAKTGLFGCPECYSTFEDRLDELFLKLHGKNRHVKTDSKKIDNVVNKQIKKESNEDKIERLKQKIEELVKNENYEEAAIVRDEIKKIERKNK
ncbi:MAG: UvrB/UvrC motif-containing protein [Clostridia bacterium]